jgi:histidinol-phosphate phosphatase family protein
MNWLAEVNNSWTLFLDRDGVINEEIDGDYVRTPEQLVIYPNVPQAIAQFNKIFSKIIIVTNQRCIDKGIITHAQLLEIHNSMLQQLKDAGAYIHHIYYAPFLLDTHPMRKPNIGMALQAVADYPSINLSKSIMVGNSPSDILFGINAGIKTVFVETTKPGKGNMADIVLPDLPSLLNYLPEVTLG